MEVVFPVKVGDLFNSDVDEFGSSPEVGSVHPGLRCPPHLPTPSLLLVSDSGRSSSTHVPVRWVGLNTVSPLTLDFP